MKIFLAAGEASGDARGAEVMQALIESRSGIEFTGLGGPRMKAIACSSFHDWIERAGVIGFIDVLKNYGFFKKQFNATLADILCLKPDAVILIDYPGFNLRLASAIRKANPAQRIIYYISPQVWAWNRGRIPKMARIIDLMICIFPFEKPLYERSGLRTVFVGHPMLDSLGVLKKDVKRDENLIALLPGSRKREIKKIFPVMIQAAVEILEKRPGSHFESAATSNEMRERMLEILARLAPGLPCEITVGGAYDLMQRASAGMVASGTATLEAAFFRLPYVLVYRVAWLTYFIGRRLIKVQWLGMVNILAGREVVPEYLQDRALPKPVADKVMQLAQDGPARKQFLSEIEKVMELLGETGAGRRAAKAILDEIG